MPKRKAPSPKKAAPAKKVKETRATKKKAEEEKSQETESGYDPQTQKDNNPVDGSTQTSWEKLIRETTIRDICQNKRPMVVIPDNATLEEALDTLSKGSVLGLPVVNESKKKFYGFIDVLDIAGFVLATWKKASIDLAQPHFPTFLKTKVTEVLNFSNVDPSIFLSLNDPLESAIQTFCDPRAYFRLHRIAVLDKGKVVNVLTQSDIVYFAAEHTERLSPTIRDLPVSGLTGLIRAPVCVRLDTPFSETLETLYMNRISGLALIDHEFKLCSNLSASDLRGMNSLGFESFNGSVLQYLVKGTDSETPRNVSRIKPEDTFSHVLSVFKSEKVHRLYITNSLEQPVGFISMIDMIARLNM